MNLLKIVVALAALVVCSWALPLDDYVALPDPSYKWELANTVAKEGYTLYILKLTSQTWNFVSTDKPVWQHWVRLAIPNGEVRGKTCVIYSSYGDNPLGNPPSSTESFIAQLALDTGLISVELNQIPNQPLTFAGESEGRSEDSLLAKTWDLFIQSRDPFVIARLPMTKAVVRAMDAIQEFTSSLSPFVSSPSSFVLAGGSKRGWTTWLAGAVDKRVTGIAPLVIDVLDMLPNFNEIWQTYGRWPAALSSYVDQNITRCLNCPVFQELAGVEDPLVYLERFKERNVPVFAVNANGDEFFIPTGWKFWFPQYTGEKLLRYLPNAEHSLATALERVVATLTTFVWSVEKNVRRPSFSWSLNADHSSITLKSSVKPLSVKLWQAYNRLSRAFILNCYLTCLWRSEELIDQGNNTYVGTVEIPTRGFRAFMLEVEYDVGFKFPLTQSTGVSIVPDRFEHEPCPDSECGLCDTC